MTERLLETTKTKDEELYCVYCHRNKTNGKRYIGQTIHQDNPDLRWKNGTGYKDSLYFYNAIKKYGWDAFDHYIIQDNLTKEEADELEELNIILFDTLNHKYGYNLKHGGSNGQLSEQSKQKLSASLKIAFANPEYRKNISEKRKQIFSNPEVREKFSKSHIGKKASEETKQKMSKAHKGNTYTKDYMTKHPEYSERLRIIRKEVGNRPENKQKASKIMLGLYAKNPDLKYSLTKNAHEANKKPIIQCDVQGNIIRIYSYIQETKDFGFNPKCVSDCCRGIHKTHKGFVFRYKEEVM